MRYFTPWQLHGAPRAMTLTISFSPDSHRVAGRTLEAHAGSEWLRGGFPEGTWAALKQQSGRGTCGNKELARTRGLGHVQQFVGGRQVGVRAGGVRM